jgi:stress response protein SCP2
MSPAIAMSKGQVLELVKADERPLTQIRIGLGWDEERNAGYLGTGNPEVDLDASAVQFTGNQLFDLAFYNNLATRDGSVVHLGDNLTGGGEGDDEVITVDLTRVYAKVDTIAFLVSSYQGHSLTWVGNAYCRVVDDEDNEIARFNLTNGVPETGLVMATLIRSGDAWKLRAIGEGIAVKLPTESVKALQPYL